jgi:Cu/Ag efflux protein CusF
MEKPVNRIINIAAALALTVGLSAGAMAAESAPISGEVKKVDEAAGKVTLKHGPAKSLGMDEPMTMVYRVKDPSMLRQVKAGDKVTFEAEEAASGYTVTRLVKAKQAALPPHPPSFPGRCGASNPECLPLGLSHPISSPSPSSR